MSTNHGTAGQLFWHGLAHVVVFPLYFISCVFIVLYSAYLSVVFIISIDIL